MVAVSFLPGHNTYQFITKAEQSVNQKTPFMLS